jgi:hypothetical protein
MSDNIPGLFKAKSRTPIRNEPGDYVIGTLYSEEFFYAEHLHPKKHKDDWWVWGYTGGEFKNFGWVNRLHLKSVKHMDRLEHSYARRVRRFFDDGGHRNRNIRIWTAPPQPTGHTAQGRVYIHKPIHLYGNRSCRRWFERLVPDAPGKKGSYVSWRYILKGRQVHLVVFHPMGHPVYGHGRWGFIKNDPGKITVIHNNGTTIK